MTVNRKIEDALGDLVNGNIWPLLCPLETLPDEWITYQPEYEGPEDFGDDQDLEWVHYLQIHWFKAGYANYYNVRSEIRDRLKAAGFTMRSFVENVETESDGSKFTHLVCTCCISEDMG